MKPSPPSAPDSPSAASRAAQLAQQLGALRDALVTLSLSLKDWQYEIDSQGAQQTHAQAAQALDTARQRPQPSATEQASRDLAGDQ